MSASQPCPFDETLELNSSLVLSGDLASPTVVRRARTDEGRDDGASGSTASTHRSHISNHLPGQPNIPLSSPHDISSHIQAELLTPNLNIFAPHLWLVATQNSSHISALHRQIVRGREIIITEDPELHLVWAYDRVYVKPLPKWLLSSALWVVYVSDDERVEKAAKGFLRSWYHLVKHRSDFQIAREKRLVPNYVRFGALVRFLARFRDIADEEVAERYAYGDLRLTRLNLWSKFILGRWTFHKLYGQYGPYFARFYGPLLFIFGVLSVVLSALQVALSVQQGVPGGLEGHWLAFAATARWVAVATLVAIGAVAVALMLLFCGMVVREGRYAGKDLWKKRKGG
ncbi:MAG: hypothetical protein M1813_004174 [Trichoglossum hirsutum]|jgi:hypothetical protein|nr:MAG: hypothetical protein M1813_004174 [Trichoglossum hirsutum]